MQFIYHSNAKDEEIVLDGKQFKHVFVSRRHKKDDVLRLQNLKDEFAYFYKVEGLDKKSAELILVDKQKIDLVYQEKSVALAVIDPKDLKEAVRALAQMGQKKFIFFYAQRSQKNYKIDAEKLKEIIIHSYELAGVGVYPEIKIYKNLQNLLENEKDKNIFMLDFNGKTFDEKIKAQIDILLVGPEGGFTEKERNLFKNKIVSFSIPITLSAKIASVSAGAKLFL